MSKEKRANYRKTFTDSAILYALHFSNYIPPLVVFPYLARKLGPFHLGLVASSQAVALMVTTAVDYGFFFTAAREVARHRTEPEELTRICSGVLGARLILSVIATLGVIVIGFIVPDFRQHPIYLIGGLLFGLTQGFRFDWFFMGMDRMSRIGIPALITNPLSLATIMLVVTKPSRAPWVLVIQALAAGGVTLWNGAWVHNQIGFAPPNMKESRYALKSSWSLFISRSSIALYTSANTIILGIVASQTAVSFYAGADKLTKAFIAGLQPFGQILYPKVNRALVSSPEGAVRLLRIGLIAIATIAISMAVISSLVSPLIVRILLGPQYMASIPMVRILSGLIIIASFNSFFSYQWVLPFGLDHLLARTTFLAGGLDLILSVILSRRYQGVGSALAVVVAEAIATSYLYFSLRRENLNPFVPSSVLSGLRTQSLKESTMEETDDRINADLATNEAMQ